MRFLLFGSLAVLALERLWELRVSSRHVRALRARGGVEHGAGHYRPLMVFHVLYFVALPVEVLLLARTPPRLWPLFAVVSLAGFALRNAARLALGERWTARVIVVPGLAPVRSGLYRWVRHPNYAGLVLEMLGLPLAFGAWLTTLYAALGNAVFVTIRIRTEERALGAAAGYAEAMAGIPRLVPGRRPRGGA
jgi:methyltransferase